MLIVKMAFRNVFRNRRRSIITIAAIACGIFTLVTMRGVLDGIGKQSELNLIDMQFGHLQVFKAGFYDNPGAGLSDAIQDPEKVIAALDKIKHVKAGVERLTLPAMINFKGNELPCLAVGIDLSADEKVFDLSQAVVEGRGKYLTPGPHAMIGEKMAKTLGIDTGDRVVWKSRALGKEGGGAIQAMYLEVEGILSTGNPAIDGAVLFIPLDFMQESLLAEGRATQVVVRMDNLRYLQDVQLAAAAVLEPLGFEIKNWEDMSQAFLELHRVKTVGNTIMVGVFLLIVMVGIINTMLMATFERVKEIGMLMAMGFRAIQIRWLFLVEGALLGLIGSLIGIGVGSPLVWLSEKYGIPIDIFTGGQDVEFGYPIRGFMYGDLSLELVLWSLMAGVLISTLATVLPARRASRLDPSEALRHA